MKPITNVVHQLDVYQQRHPVLAFPFAVFKKFGEDQAGNQGALLTYYAFLSLFPLLLVLVSVAEIISRASTELADKITDAAFSFFPVIGTQLQDNLHAGHRSGIGLFFGIIITLFGSLGVANTLQEVTNNLWKIERTARPGFLHKMLRSLGIIFIAGGGLIVTSILVGYMRHWTSFAAKILILLMALGLNFLVFLAVYRMSVVKQVKIKNIILGACIASVSWQILQALGSYLLLNKLQGSSTVYGVFAVVLGMLFWISLQAQIVLYSVEVDVVRTKKLWPRSIVQPPSTSPDKDVQENYAEPDKPLKDKKVKAKP